MRYSRLSRSVPALVATAMMAAAQVAYAQVETQAAGLAGGAGSSAATVRVDLSAGGATQSLSLPRGKSAIVELPVDVRDVLITNPAVADAVLRTPRRIYVLGMTSGQTDAVLFDASGRRILSLNIRVDADAGALSETINRVIPGARVKVEALGDSVILTGMVANPIDADRAGLLAQQYVSKPEQVLNMLSVAGKDQVMLKVRIVEVQRSVVKQLGLNANVIYNNGLQSYGFGRQNTFGTNGSLLGGASACGGQTGARTTNFNNSNTSTSSTNSGSSSSSGATNSGSVNFEGAAPSTITVRDINGNLVTIPGQLTEMAGYGANAATSTTSGSALSNVISNVVSTAYNTVTGTNASFCLQAFERVGLVRTLAEPNLTAVSGEAAKFLAGGEFPIPVSQDDTGSVTVEYKPFGVGLAFTPVVMSSGRISLKVSTEISELSSLGAFSLGSPGSTSLTIPALTVRRAETSVELPSGGSMMIAGLLQQSTKETLDSLPGVGSLPVLGSLFRSRDFLSGDTEMVVMVTAYIVDPNNSDAFQTPADGLRFANDAETILFGKLNKTVSAPPGANAGRTWQGPIGYVIE